MPQREVSAWERLTEPVFDLFSSDNLGGCFAAAAFLVGLGLLIAFGDTIWRWLTS